MKHIDLPSGGIARVANNVKPETIAALDEMTRAAAQVKFPNGCTAIYRGTPVKVVQRIRPQHGNETVNVRNLRDGKSYSVAVKNLLTEAEWEEKQRVINEAD